MHETTVAAGGQPPLKVGAGARTTVATCAPEDDGHAAVAAMKQQCVRRLAVVGIGGTVLGVLSMNDIVLAAGADEPVRSPGGAPRTDGVSEREEDRHR